MVIIVFCLNTLVFAQQRKGLNTTAQTEINHKHLFSCLLTKNTSLSSKKIETEIIQDWQLGKSQFKKIHTLKIAIVATGEYSKYFILKNNAFNFSEDQKKEIILQAIQKTISNANIVLRRDLGVQLQLVEDNKKLIFLDPLTDELNGKSAKSLINQLSKKINSIIDPNSYDIAQGFTTILGGLSSLESAFSFKKAEAVTGAPIPEGKLFDIDFFTHEIGHQLGATHTQNSNCSRDPRTSIEPGSGATIMGYAGVCHIPHSNVSETSLPYFHSISVLQIKNFISRFIKDDTSKSNQIGLEPIPDYSIPLSSPFEIELYANINNSTSVSYSCNQIDVTPSEFPPTKNQINGPVYTAQNLSVNNVISFPKKEVVFNEILNSKSGVVSNVPRIYNFLASARIIEGNKHLNSTQKFKVTVKNATPFSITSQNIANTVWLNGNEQKITWDIGETISKLNTQFVNIFLSTNNGASFDYTLASNISNNGEAIIKVPLGISSNNCRIKITAANSIYYAINKVRFSITDIKEISFNNTEEQQITESTTSEIEIDNPFSFENIELSLALKHLDISNLIISLKNPLGNTIKLWENQCVNSNELEVRFSDNGAKITKAEIPLCENKVTGLRKPIQALKQIGNSNKGTWKLQIENTANSLSSGNLKSWSIHFFAKNEIVFKDTQTKNEVTIYPNPTSDYLNITFEKPLSSNITVAFYSLKGRLILQKDIENQFCSIPVFTMAKGVYFLKTQNGNVITSQKIMIE